MISIISKSAVIETEQIKVVGEGNLIAVTVANDTFKLHYSNALQLSQWLRVRGKQSKRFAEDTGNHWSQLSDVDPDFIDRLLPKVQSAPQFPPIKVFNKPAPNVMTKQRVEVRSQNELVVLCIENSELVFHYVHALKISSLIRLVAKEVKRLNGDRSRTMSAVGVLAAKVG